MGVPFIDLKRQHKIIEAELSEKFKEILDNTAFIRGFGVKRFEEAFAKYLGVNHCVGCGNGTDALYLALRAFDIGEGDEVITQANTFFATPEAISLTGATPVFVDCDQYGLMDVSQLESRITEKTKVILPVHLFGQICDMPQVMELAEKHNLIVIEDAAQAHGATQNGKRAGSFGHAACFSFYPSKNLGACGDAGAVVTNDPKIAEAVMSIGDHGSFKKFSHLKVGVNSRMDGFQGAALEIKLKYLDTWNASRAKAAERYNEKLAEVEQVTIPEIVDSNTSVWHLYIIQVENPNDLHNYLKQKEIFTGFHYPTPCHLQPALKDLEYREGDFPEAEKRAQKQLSLPMFDHMNDSEVDEVVAAIKSYFREV